MLSGAGGTLAASEAGKAGPLGLLVIILLGVAVYFLYRSMVRHVKRVPASFDAVPPDHAGAGPAAPAPGPGGPAGHGPGGPGPAASGPGGPGGPGPAGSGRQPDREAP